jgi:hypothetical protein
MADGIEPSWRTASHELVPGAMLSGAMLSRAMLSRAMPGETEVRWYGPWPHQVFVGRRRVRLMEEMH